MKTKLAPKLLIAIVLLTLFSLSGCVSTGAQFTKPEAPPENQSVIYFYRMKSLMTNTTLPGISHNGQEVLSRLPHQCFWKYYISPGTHQFEPKQFGIYKKETLTLKNERPGQVYYVEMVVKFGYIGIELRSQDQGIAGIAGCYEVQSNGMGKQSDSKPSTTPDPTAAEAKNPSLKEAQLKSTSSLSESDAPVNVRSDNRAILHVNTTPDHSRIRIMNIKPKFYQGMELKPGKYLIEASADGYITQSKWITLQRGETKTHSVFLNPVRQAIPSPAVKQNAQKKMPEFKNPDMARIAGLLTSQNPIDKRNGAKLIIQKYPNNSQLLSLAGSELEKGHNVLLRNNYHIDAMAWICKAIGQSGRPEYKALLTRVGNQTQNKKLKKYALQNADML